MILSYVTILDSKKSAISKTWSNLYLELETATCKINSLQKTPVWFPDRTFEGYVWHDNQSYLFVSQHPKALVEGDLKAGSFLNGMFAGSYRRTISDIEFFLGRPVIANISFHLPFAWFGKALSISRKTWVKEFVCSYLNNPNLDITEVHNPQLVMGSSTAKEPTSFCANTCSLVLLEFFPWITRSS